MELQQKFKCKTCGNPLDDLVAASLNGLVECPSCYNVWTIPKKETSPEALQFLRMGEHDLDTCKFDDAFTAYKKAAELDPKEPEAYFGMALAQFKVQYLKDHVNNRVQPICHDIGDKKFTECNSYLRALLNATAEQRAEYEKKGEEIDYILGEFYKLQQSGKRYDCFICVKVTDDNTKQTTEDSKDADYIYRLLQDKGYKPFYSERELRNVTGADYEARILYALYTSECMLVVCRNEEYLQTPWVKNEYTRFLKLIGDEEKESDSITFVFNGTPVEKLPGRAGKIQGINFALRESDGKIVDFVETHTPEARKKRDEAAKRSKVQEEQILQQIEEQKRLAEEQQKRQHELEERLKNLQTRDVPVSASTATVQSLLTRAWQEMNARDFTEAEKYFKNVLDTEPTCGEAWRGSFLAEFQILKEEEIANYMKAEHMDRILASKNFKNAVQYAGQEDGEKLKGLLDAITQKSNRLEEKDEAKINALQGKIEQKKKEMTALQQRGQEEAKSVEHRYASERATAQQRQSRGPGRSLFLCFFFSFLIGGGIALAICGGIWGWTWMPMVIGGVVGGLVIGIAITLWLGGSIKSDEKKQVQEVDGKINVEKAQIKREITDQTKEINSELEKLHKEKAELSRSVQGCVNRKNVVESLLNELETK